MLIPVKPEFLDQYLGIGLANYAINHAYLVELSVTVGGFYPLRARVDESPIYCKERKSAELILERLGLRRFTIRDGIFLIYFFPDDPHGFCLDEVGSDIHVPRVRIYSHDEIVQFLDAGRESFIYPRNEFDKVERPKRKHPKKSELTHYECSACGCRDVVQRFDFGADLRRCPNCHSMEDIFPFRMYECDACGSEGSQLECFKGMSVDMDPLTEAWPFTCASPGCESTVFHQIAVTEILPGEFARAHS